MPYYVTVHWLSTKSRSLDIQASASVTAINLLSAYAERVHLAFLNCFDNTQKTKKNRFVLLLGAPLTAGALVQCITCTIDLLRHWMVQMSI